MNQKSHQTARARYIRARRRYILRNLPHILTTVFLLIVLFLSVNLMEVEAAPAMDYVAVNENNKLCGRYWPGDEFSHYKLPRNWETHGTLSELKRTECLGAASYQECCEAMGYRFIDMQNVGYGKVGVKSPLGPLDPETTQQFYSRKIRMIVGNWRRRIKLAAQSLGF